MTKAGFMTGMFVGLCLSGCGPVADPCSNLIPPTLQESMVLLAEQDRDAGLTLEQVWVSVLEDAPVGGYSDAGLECIDSMLSEVFR